MRAARGSHKVKESQLQSVILSSWRPKDSSAGTTFCPLNTQGLKDCSMVGWTQVCHLPFQTCWSHRLQARGKTVSQPLLTLKQENNCFSNYLRGTDRWMLEVEFTSLHRLSSPAFTMLWQPCGPTASLRVMLRQQECTPWAQSSFCFTLSQHKVNEGSWMLSSEMCSFQNKSLSPVTGLPTVLFVLLL